VEWELPYFDRSFDLHNNFRTRSVLCFPIKGRTGQNLGDLQVINKKGWEPMPLRAAISLLQKEAGSHFAPEVVSAFLRCLPQALLNFRGEHFTPEYMDETLHRLAPESTHSVSGLRLS
jgi:hypothetical protein